MSDSFKHHSLHHSVTSARLSVWARMFCCFFELRLISIIRQDECVGYKEKERERNVHLIEVQKDEPSVLVRCQADTLPSVLLPSDVWFLGISGVIYPHYLGSNLWPCSGSKWPSYGCANCREGLEYGRTLVIVIVNKSLFIRAAKSEQQKIFCINLFFSASMTTIKCLNLGAEIQGRLN